MAAFAPIFVIVFGVPFAIILATPTRYLGFYLLWLAMLGVLSVVWPRGTDHSSPFAGTDAPIEMAILVVCAAFILFKLVAVVLWRLNRTQRASEAASRLWKSKRLGLVLAAATGAFAAPWSMFVLAMLLSDRSSALLAHGAPFIFAIVALTLFAASWIVPHTLMRTFSGALAVSAVINLTVAASFIASRITSVVDSAEAIAKGNPYCIQVATANSGFQSAATRLDLSPLSMRIRCVEGWCFENHAILAIDSQGERKLMNWSHRYREFRNDVLNATTKPPAVVCQPARGFAGQLPMFYANSNSPD